MTPAEHKRFVGRQVMLARESTGLRPSRFSKRIGLSQSQLSNIEKGTSYPPPTALVAACREFGFTTDWFYRGLTYGATEDASQSLREAERKFLAAQPSLSDGAAGA